MKKLRIKVTKDIIQKAMYCGYNPKSISESCAIALAVKDIFPEARVSLLSIVIDRVIINLPKKASDFISLFDSLTAKERLHLDPIEFDVEVPDVILEKINIDDLTKCETLELIN